ncbi:hypothetical protein DSL72_004523 [Monilinia vaccinii-corymbosi]|uniref:G-protein coupled receptors family 2 profile 2 domain-containing protein n=1 Tax=Monilinia vaccinii-corymbosi TaxID=61207 RepID=A0A8A3NWC4_9HELO|nr:hypothetical protein DSL72_004523 [Monilinia vaccinii-corymbosi]
MNVSISEFIGQGQCPPPFIAADLYPETGGFIKGRFCSDRLGINCCLPCPQTDWFYGENVRTLTASANWVNVIAMACSVYLLLGFIVPLTTNPDQCYNAITPNDMTTSFTCAISGAFVIAGGWSGVMWVFLRSLAVHLQICWQVVLGESFMWGALATGWGIPAVGVTFAMIFSGVSFRFGDTCHINHDNSLPNFWVPLLLFSAATLIIQFVTFGYCIKVYLSSLSDSSDSTGASGVLPSYTHSVTTASPRDAYRRIRRVIELQWRGIAIALVIVTDVIFFALVFVFMDDLNTTILKNPLMAEKWLICLLRTAGNKTTCLPLAGEMVVNEATLGAVLILLSCNGGWAAVFLGRKAMFTGWAEMFRSKIKPENEFVSADVHAFKDPMTYEMLNKEQGQHDSQTPVTSETPYIATPASTHRKSGRGTPEYFGREARYKSPSGSFSRPNPNPNPPLSWDSTQTYAPPMDPVDMSKL